ncbi:MAG: ubiquinone/menaquinone biosynthesis C-methylase UbiE [Alteromonadaceae bacterium]|jgi:ubiquinone/menaquinone biosynthesis C-methylase UbiE
MVKGLTVKDYQRVTSFYNERYKEKGNDISSVGWSGQESQYLRFDVLFRDYDPKGKTILDVGCGFGDLYDFLVNKFGNSFHYIGIDISASLIDEANKKHVNSCAEFYQADLLSLKQYSTKSVDFAVESGMLSFKLENNDEYAQQTMQQMFLIANDGVALNFLTDQVDYQLEKNHHYAVFDVLSWASKLSRSFVIYHDYPLWEFTIKILKGK